MENETKVDMLVKSFSLNNKCMNADEGISYCNVCKLALAT